MQSRVVRKAIVNKLGCEESQGRKHIKYREMLKKSPLLIERAPDNVKEFLLTL
jgi:hypothetical protein